MSTTSTSGFTLIEVLIAIVLVGMVVGSIALSIGRLAQNNSQAELQSLKASAAESIAKFYAHQIPQVGTTTWGSMSGISTHPDLSPREQQLWQSLTYSLKRPNANTIQITVSQTNADKNPLNITIRP